MFKKIAFVIALAFTHQLQAEHNGTQTKSADDFFKRWSSWKKAFPEQALTDIKSKLNQDFVNVHNAIIAEHGDSLAPLIPLINHLHNTNHKTAKPTHMTRMTESCKKRFNKVYDLLEQDTAGFLAHLDEIGLTKAVNESSLASAKSTEHISAYTNFLKLLFSLKDKDESDCYLFNAANSFFEYCFVDHWDQCKSMFFEKQSYPLLKFLYANMWLFLAGSGWRNWHQNTLDNLATQAQKGKEIIYIAGGGDWDMLVKHLAEQDIPFNITIIDPQLPTQPLYYPFDWEWIIASSADDGGIGDEIVYPINENKTITLVRSNFQEGGFFHAHVSNGEMIPVVSSKTTWNAVDQSGKQVGTLTLDRRFCTQKDFEAGNDKAILISFNELYFITLTEYLGGWKIETSKFDTDTNLFVKQLRKPLNKETLKNLTQANLYSYSDFQFIALGTCVN
ncbi:MAG: hypothetical protein H6679_01845 [Epsilonproteobacteria bacterium]|nr:hypothetical protein [Campylobacterota bacterium]